MGYTHYWTHSTEFTDTEWLDVKDDLSAIVAEAKRDGIGIGSFCGESGIPVPTVDVWDGQEVVGFNGIGEESHETFVIYQKRRPLEEWQDKSRHGWDFCKTARKPYDVAVTASLIYLESFYPSKFSVSSDGTATDWESGFRLARRALPIFEFKLRLPRDL